MNKANRKTVEDLRALRGKAALSMLRVETMQEAEAAEAAGIDMLSVPPELMKNPVFRQIAPKAFTIPGANFFEVGGTDEYIRWAFSLLEAGADAVYCSSSYRTIKRLREEGVPVCSHVGLIPAKCTWTGGFKAVGKTLEKAQFVWNQVRALEDAGAFAAEIEVVPDLIAAEIAKRTSLFLISMGSGASCDAQYLFAEDILGYNSGHIPRHAKIYRNFKEEYERLQKERIAAFGEYASDVKSGAYPASGQKVSVSEEVHAQFAEWLDKT